LKNDLTLLRLRGGIFAVKIRQSPYTLEITSTGKIILMENEIKNDEKTKSESSLFEHDRQSKLEIITWIRFIIWIFDFN